MLTGLGLIIIVANDGAWGTELHGQHDAIGRDINTRLGQLPYEHLGAAFAAHGIRVETREELSSALNEAFARNGTTIINVLLDQEAGKELKTNEDVRMILFNDILSGQDDLIGNEV